MLGISHRELTHLESFRICWSKSAIMNKSLLPEHTVEQYMAQLRMSMLKKRSLIVPVVTGAEKTT